MIKIGYARISTHDQRLDLQRDALKAAGCSVIYEDVISGSRSKRDGLNQALAKLSPDVVLVVWRLDRLGRSLSHLVEVLKFIEEKKAGFIKAADRISAYLKCQAELKAGNTEFEIAAQKLAKNIHELQQPEVVFFMQTFAPSCSLTLDGLMQTS